MTVVVGTDPVRDITAPTAPGRAVGAFTKSFTQQPPIPEAGIAAAADVMRSGRLHRYGAEDSHAARLERRFAEWQGSRFCVAVASGGQAMQIALRAAGVRAGDPVLMNAWTLAPVPGAAAAVGAAPVLVEVTDDLVIDLDDLAAKAEASGARVLLLSHMRGHVADMGRLSAWAASAGIAVIEDCAHTMGAEWDGRRLGSFGAAGCFSAQTYKHLNAGEGGLLTSDDPAIAARATVLSGSYMMWDRHGAGPDRSAFADAALDCPNTSARMDEVRAALLLPQIDGLDDALVAWEDRAAIVEAAIADAPGIVLPRRDPRARRIGSSVQWRMPALDARGCHAFLADCDASGVAVKWFGVPAPEGFTSAHPAWRYIRAHALPRTDRVLATLFDMRLPLTFSEEDCAQIGAILQHAAARAADRTAS